MQILDDDETKAWFYPALASIKSTDEQWQKNFAGFLDSPRRVIFRLPATNRLRWEEWAKRLHNGWLTTTTIAMDESLPLVVIAMEAEANPVEELNLTGEGNTCRRHLSPTLVNESVHVVINGSDSRFGVDAIGTLPASLQLFWLLRKQIRR